MYKKQTEQVIGKMLVDSVSTWSLSSYLQVSVLSSCPDKHFPPQVAFGQCFTGETKKPKTINFFLNLSNFVYSWTVLIHFFYFALKVYVVMSVGIAILLREGFIIVSINPCSGDSYHRCCSLKMHQMYLTLWNPFQLWDLKVNGYNQKRWH